METREAPELPFHFSWRDGPVTSTLGAALAAMEAMPDAARWHLAEGHLQAALAGQGYQVLAEHLSGADTLPLLRERIRIALELHRTWWLVQEEGDSLAAALTTLGRVLRGKGSTLLASSRKNLSAWRNRLAELIADKKAPPGQD